MYLLHDRENNITPQVDSYTALIAGYASIGDLDGIQKVSKIMLYIIVKKCTFPLKLKKKPGTIAHEALMGIQDDSAWEEQGHVHGFQDENRQSRIEYRTLEWKTALNIFCQCVHHCVHTSLALL